jgi:hypothetical protein
MSNSRRSNLRGPNTLLDTASVGLPTYENLPAIEFKIVIGILDNAVAGRSAALSPVGMWNLANSSRERATASRLVSIVWMNPDSDRARRPCI